MADTQPAPFASFARRYLGLTPGAGWWSAGALVLCLVLLSPVGTIIWLALTPVENIWPHLLSTVLPGYVWRTLALMAGVGTLTFIIGTGTAWLITMCRFPGRRVFQWLLLVPLAMPTYIIAFTYVDIFDYAGPVQSALRALFGWRLKADYWFPEIRSLGGAIVVMSLVLFPYVFLTARASFIKQSVCHLEVARTLGRSPWGVFFSVALPLARPAIAVGVSLAMMECLNDIGAVEFFGVRTLTLGIYSTWLGRGNLGGAAQIAFVMLAFVFAVLWLERAGRRDRAFHHTTKREQPISRFPLSGWRQAAACMACLLPVVFGFALPALVLLGFAVSRFEDAATGAYLVAASNTLMLASLSAVAAVAIGLFLAYANRLAGSGLVRLAVRLASLGYAIPGTVLGIGLLIPLARADNFLSGLAERLTGTATGLIMTGTLIAVSFGYVVRFLAISHGNLETGLEKVTPNLTAAARTLGRSPWRTLIAVHLPLIRPAIVSAALLVFVDCMKELPATLILRPFNFETLATMVYSLASLDQLEESALAALTIVVSGIIPVIVLSRSMLGPRRRQGIVQA
jgi:iron(III) transport system permease protein